MRTKKGLAFIFMICFFGAASLCFCWDKDKKVITGDEAGFKFGRAYNPVRKKMGSPLIKSNMVVNNCCGDWTIYRYTPGNDDLRPYHASKTIRLIQGDWLCEEKDIYRKDINDTTFMQLNILSRYNKADSTCTFKCNEGMVDKRSLEESATKAVLEGSAYKAYSWTTLEISGADSVLSSWKLNRSDEY